MKILEAYKLAATLHAGQLDKSGRPYIEHLSRVFLRVCEASGTNIMRIAALLHDSIEDGKATPQELMAAGVPPMAVDLIDTLSRSERETYAEYIDRVAIDNWATGVKLADLADNMDPERVAAFAAIDPAKSARLMKRYEAAVAALVKTA